MKRVQNKEKESERAMTLADKINIVIAVFSAIAVFFSFLTVVEMRKDRKAAYKPALLINPLEYKFSWNENGNENWIEDMSYNSTEKFDYKEDGTIEGTISVPIRAICEGGMESIAVVNIGAGNARDVVFEWDKNNINRLNEYLISCDETKKEFMSADQSVAFSLGNGIVATDVPDKYGLMYMVAEANETYDVPFPMAYSVLIHEIIKTKKYDDNLPYLVLTAKYHDILGNENMDVFLLQIKPKLVLQNETGDGSATFQLVPAFWGK